MKAKILPAPLVTALLAGCIPAAAQPPARTPPPPPPPRVAQAVAPPVQRPVTQPDPEPVSRGPDAVIGRNARGLTSLFGPADLDVYEGNGRKLQFLGPNCVLDIYLYPPRGGGEPVATHVDARLPDGRDTDRSECVEALSRR